MDEKDKAAKKKCSLNEDDLREFLLLHNINKNSIEKLIQQGLDGQTLHIFTADDFEQLGIPKAHAIHIVKIRD